MTTLYRDQGGTLTALGPMEPVTIAGTVWGAATAAQRFDAPTLARAGLYHEQRLPDEGRGWEPPTLVLDSEAVPTVLFAPVRLTVFQAYGMAVEQVTEHAKAMQVAAAGPYAWPEAAVWRSLEAQARAYLADPTGPLGDDFAADVGTAQDPEELEARALSIVAKADTFRALAGLVKTWRRSTLTNLAAALAIPATPAEILDLATQAIAMAGEDHP
jgi:hypothetical protein